MNRMSRAAMKMVLLPLAMVSAGGSEVRSSSSIGSDEEDTLGDHMSPAMRRVYEEARKAAEAEAEQNLTEQPHRQRLTPPVVL